MVPLQSVSQVSLHLQIETMTKISGMWEGERNQTISDLDYLVNYPIHCGKVPLTVHTGDGNCEGNGSQLTQTWIELSPFIVLG